MTETPPTRDQLVQNIINSAIKDKILGERGDLYTKKNQNLLLETVREIIIDPTYIKAEEAHLKAYADLKALSESIQIAHRNSELLDDNKYDPRAMPQDSSIKPDLPISQRGARHGNYFIRTEEEDKLFNAATKLEADLSSKRTELVRTLAGKNFDERYIDLIFFSSHVVTGSMPGELGINQRLKEGKDLNKAFRDLLNLKEAYPALVDYEGRLPEDITKLPGHIKKALVAAKDNDNVISDKEFEEIKQLVVPNVKPPEERSPK